MSFVGGKENHGQICFAAKIQNSVSEGEKKKVSVLLLVKQEVNVAGGADVVDPVDEAVVGVGLEHVLLPVRVPDDKPVTKPTAQQETKKSSQVLIKKGKSESNPRIVNLGADVHPLDEVKAVDHVVGLLGVAVRGLLKVAAQVPLCPVQHDIVGQDALLGDQLKVPLSHLTERRKKEKRDD